MRRMLTRPPSYADLAAKRLPNAHRRTFLLGMFAVGLLLWAAIAAGIYFALR
jgi:hypothetical protein